MNRRLFLCAIGASAIGLQSVNASEVIAKLQLSDAAWRARLPDAAYQVLRHEDTERPNSSPLVNEHRAGTYVCRG
ncbi:MAG: peptide-methionine (R)-S-oxide reductase [Hyphomonadaceae bacterium]|nr:MAG: peptide-methionine (R)-S-oxide reductase [Hyphomonadaceae bacterium]